MRGHTNAHGARICEYQQPPYMHTCIHTHYMHVWRRYLCIWRSGQQPPWRWFFLPCIHIPFWRVRVSITLPWCLRRHTITCRLRHDSFLHPFLSLSHHHDSSFFSKQSVSWWVSIHISSLVSFDSCIIQYHATLDVILLSLYTQCFAKSWLSKPKQKAFIYHYQNEKKSNIISFGGYVSQALSVRIESSIPVLFANVQTNKKADLASALH